MRPGFNIGVDSGKYEKSQSIVIDKSLNETLEYATQFGATDLIIQSYLERTVRGEEKWELEDILNLKNKVESYGYIQATIESVKRNAKNNGK
tara:strand:- start:304 stop:579 length:276 start_codon:yes stop_codon:yes gene_type:complete